MGHVATRATGFLVACPDEQAHLGSSRTGSESLDTGLVVAGPSGGCVVTGGCNSVFMGRAAAAPSPLGVTRAAAIVPEAVFLLVTIAFVADRVVSAGRSGLLAVDFRHTFLPAAEAILDGRSPYPEYGYPPLVAFLSVPFAVAPASDYLASLALAGCVPLSLWLLGVRDWRCYAAAFLWAPVFNGIQTANVTLALLLAAAACWRLRDRQWASGSVAGLATAAKIIAWPLAVWLAATRRWAGAAALVVCGAAVTLGLWAALGFAGIGGFGGGLGSLAEEQAPRGYSLLALAQDAGLPGILPELLAALVALGILAATVVFGVRGDDERSYACAVCAMVAVTPIVWLHSFALLLAPLALLRPRFSPLWLAPAALWLFAPGTGNGEPWQTASTLALAGLVAVVALVPSRQRALEAR